MDNQNRAPADQPIDFRQQVKSHVAQGCLDAAIRVCDRELGEAQVAEDSDRADQAICTRAGLLILRGDGQSDVPTLKKILLRTSNLKNRFNASYQISHFHYLRGDSQKSLFYAQQSLRYAEELADDEPLLCAHNSIGNAFLLDSYFDRAESSYRSALPFHEAGDSVGRAILLSNIGYCQTVTGRLASGYRTLTESLRMMRRLRIDSTQHLPLLGLSYACMEIRRYERARRHANRALELAEQAQASSGIKNALYLLGEAEKLCGCSGRAYERFHELQKRFYPENAMVIDVLMAADVRKMINLMA